MLLPPFLLLFRVLFHRVLQKILVIVNNFIKTLSLNNQPASGKPFRQLVRRAPAFLFPKFPEKTASCTQPIRNHSSVASTASYWPTFYPKQKGNLVKGRLSGNPAHSSVGRRRLGLDSVRDSPAALRTARCLHDPQGPRLHGWLAGVRHDVAQAHCGRSLIWR